MQLSQSLAIKIGAWAAIVLGAGALTLVELITQSYYVDIVVSALSGMILACIVKLARPQRARSFLFKGREANSQPQRRERRISRNRSDRR